MNPFHQLKIARPILLSVAVLLSGFLGSPLPVSAQAPQTAKPSGRPELTLGFTPDSPYALAWAPDGKTLVSGTEDGYMRVWDARTGALKLTIGKYDFSENILSIAFSKDGKFIWGGDDNGKLRLWNVAMGALVRTYKQPDMETAHFRAVRALALSPDGKIIASGDEDKVIILWDAATGAVLYTLNGHEGKVNSLAFSPDGNTLASGGEDCMRLWDGHTGAPLGDITEDNDDSVTSVAWSPDGKTIALGRPQMRVFDFATKRITNKGKIPFIPFLGTVNSVAFSPDSKLLATGHGFTDVAGKDCAVRIWDPTTSEIKQTFRGHKYPTLKVAFSHDGKRLASLGGDGALKIWSVDGSRPQVSLVPLPAEDSYVVPSNWIAMTDEGFFDASNTKVSKEALKWRVGKKDFPLETYEATFRRPDVIQRLLSSAPIPPDSEIGLLLASRSAPPSVAFVSPANKEKVKTDTVSVQVDVSDDVGVPRMEFRVNGRPVKVSFSIGAPVPITDANRATALGGKAAPLSHNQVVRYSTNIPLPPGESKLLIRAIASDVNGLEGFADINIERELVARGMVLSTLTGLAALEAEKSLQGNLYVLSVGVSKYKNPTYNLQYTVSDANAFSALWPPMQDKLYKKVILTSLADEKVTVAGLKAQLAALTKITTNNDTVFIFLAGHGLRTANQEFYFATHEAEFENPQTTALPWTALTSVLAEVPAKRVVLFLDACHSGSALGEARASNERMAETLVKRAGVMVFASSRGDQVSFESAEWQHGAFTKAVLEGIQEGKANLDTGMGQDGNITVAKLLVYLQARVPKMTKEQQHPACPLMQDFGEPFRLAKLP